MSLSTNFRIIIAGGGVAGLTLANALERAGIDYVLLERRDTIAPQVGASIGIGPNGCRILDQLGMLGELLKKTDPILWMADRDNKGRLICPRSDVCKLGLARTGYDLSWGDRQILLQILFDNVQDKSKILLNKNVIKIEHRKHGISVTCDDESSFEGTVLAGADGVASRVRQELWNLAEPRQPELVSRDKDLYGGVLTQGGMLAEYRCLFGIASSVQLLETGDLDIGYDTDRSIFMITVKNGRVYYFLFERLKALYRFGNIPHYSTAEAVAFATKHGDMCIRPGFKFSDLWHKTISFRLVALEEAAFKIWTCRRIVCLGDSIHKMTPNIGAGGNAAIESAAALANSIKDMVDRNGFEQPSESDIEECLRGYQKCREERATAVVNTSGKLTRLQALRGPFDRVFLRYLLPNLGDFLQDMASDMVIGASMLEYLPPPKASLSGTMPFNPLQGEGKKENKLKRALTMLPILGLFYLAMCILNVDPLLPWLSGVIETGKMSFGNHHILVQKTFYRINWLDKFWAPINVAFIPALYSHDAESREQLISFLTDYGVIICIWTIESTRRSNALTFSQIPSLFLTLGQLHGIGVISPLYYFLHYVNSPIETFKATDMRLTRMNYTLGILPAIILTYYIPCYAMIFWPSPLLRQSWLFVWQMFPIWIPATTSIFSSIFPDTMMEDRVNAPKRDLPVVRYTLGTSVWMSASFWIWTWFINPSGMAVIFLPRALPATTSELSGFMREFFKFDQIFLFSATFIWLGYLFWDMKHAHMVQSSWLTIITYAASMIVLFGPGAAAGLGWLWREDIITNKRHKAAIVEATRAKAE